MHVDEHLVVALENPLSKLLQLGATNTTNIAHNYERFTTFFFTFIDAALLSSHLAEKGKMVKSPLRFAINFAMGIIHLCDLFSGISIYCFRTSS